MMRLRSLTSGTATRNNLPEVSARNIRRARATPSCLNVKVAEVLGAFSQSFCFPCSMQSSVACSSDYPSVITDLILR
jgi:hypothetical protein